MKYTNKDYYDYISKIDSIDNPLHKLYQKVLSVLLNEGLNRTISDEGMKFFFKIFEIRQYQFEEEVFSELNQLLYYDSAFKRVIKKNNESYSIYPKLKEFPTSKDLLQYYSLSLKMDVKEIISFLTPLIDSKKKELKKSKIDIYYGDPKYLILRTKAVYDAIVLLSNRDDVENKALVNQSLEKVAGLLNMMLKTVGIENSNEVFSELEKKEYELIISKDEYDSIRKCYIEILDCENNLADISNKIWKLYALNNDGVFIHQLTGDAVESDKMDKICTSFYSKNVNIITQYMDGSIGYAYPMDIANTFAVCETDVGSWRVTKEEFIERGILDSWQLDETNIWYEYPHHSKLFLPDYIESQIINCGKFAEIVINNKNQKVKPLYCFYTSNATPSQITKINSLAKLQGLEVKYLAIEKNMIKK